MEMTIQKMIDALEKKKITMGENAGIYISWFQYDGSRECSTEIQLKDVLGKLQIYAGK